MRRLFCDGCGTETRPTITGERTDGSSGLGLPGNGDSFHWCRGCAAIAFHAIATYPGTLPIDYNTAIDLASEAGDARRNRRAVTAATPGAWINGWPVGHPLAGLAPTLTARSCPTCHSIGTPRNDCTNPWHQGEPTP